MLEINQIQSLTNRNAIAAFFAALGYNVNARLEQTAANLGISPESTVRRIKHIERIANQEDYFQIYLFEVDSVTVDMTRSLARTFRDFQGHFLLVLTSDYERIDFVLVETLLPAGESPGPMQSQQKRGFRPLALSVKRLAPGRVDLRVLARFEYTEADPHAQYEKLLSAYSVAFWSEENFNNRALFSDYFLVERLRDRPEWREDIAAPFATLHGLLAKGAASFAGHPEAFLRTALLLPIFQALGFVAKEQKKATDDVQKPDFSLHAGNASEPVTLALTYCWNRNLDGPDDTRDPDTPQENPSQTVITVMEQGLCDWAIVTNGKIWRLYSKKAHSRATNYYEIDLPEILALPDSSEAFRYFWLFFRSLAFVSSGEAEDRKCFLDELLDGSEIYAKKLGERLKDRVFREVFPHFADGFVAGIGGTEKLLALPVEERSALLSEFFQGTLTFLYRILFLSYAEARDLLPVKERRGYYQKSLLRIKEELREKGGQSESTRAGKLAKTYGLSGRDLYDRLTELFTLIDKGDPSINLPTYNGGLFMTQPADGDDTEEAAHARFLRDHFIPDRHLAMGLDLMARVEDEKKLELVFIDYKSLGVRQLGSIYEGLLEFKVDIATEKLGVVKLKGKDVYRPWRELSDREHKATERRGDVIDKGDIYLSNDKSERKATGSYYTPDYIVEYIVEHAVGPVLQEKFDAMRPKLREAQRRYKESVELNRQRAKAGSKAQDPDLVVGNTYADLAEGLFDLKVLDPAMGSGHFLVEVVDFVTDRIIDFLNGFPWNPVVSRLRRMRESILQHMDESGISIDHARLTDTNLLKRHVLKRCIYGVDINPMAVELAKVSLWLDCFTIGAPLSFLDHHLKPGNSLIGTDIATVTKAVETKQLLLFSSSKFAGVMLGADLMRQVGRLSDVTLEQMNQSRREYKRARDELAPYKRLLDVYVSRWFGNALVKEIATVRDQQSGQARKGKIDRDYAVEFLQSADAERWAQNPGQLDGMEKLHRQIAERTMTASKTQRFFHWELEFPEVYYGPRPGTTQTIERMENAGFDAVVGNPPYVRVQRLVYDDTDYFKDIYSAAYRRVDIAALFLQQSTLLLGERRTCSLILSDQFTGEYRLFEVMMVWNAALVES